MKIQVPLEWSWGTGAEWKVVDAEIVDVAPHLAHLATFVVHEEPNEWMRKWAVSNVETGWNIARGKTRIEAIRNAAEKCRTTSARKFIARMNKANKQLRHKHNPPLNHPRRR